MKFLRRNVVKNQQTEPGGGRDRDGVRQDPPDIVEDLQREDRVLHRIPYRLPRSGTPLLLYYSQA